MGKDIVLRILEGTELNPKVSQALDELLPNHKIEYFNEKPHFKRSIKRRIQSLHEAFIFLLNAYPLDPKFTALSPETVENYALECRDACDLRKSSLEDLHKQLELYIVKMIGLISLAWGGDSTKSVEDAVNFLNEAEQFVLMKKGRANLATLISVGAGPETSYILQLDEALPPYYDQWLNELKEIKARDYPKTPHWFTKLEEFEQVYFCNTGLTSNYPNLMTRDLNKLISDWEEAKKISTHLKTELKQIKENTPPFADWYNDLNPGQQAILKVLSDKHPSEIDEKLRRFKGFIADKSWYRPNEALFNKLPLWYWLLSKTQQAFLIHVLKSTERVEEVVSFLPSRQRYLPAPANFAAHRLISISSEGEMELLAKERIRSSHIASRDVLKLPVEVQKRHSEANLAQVMSRSKPNQLCILQTLISPVYLMEWCPNKLLEVLPDLPPDLELSHLAQEAVKSSPLGYRILELNHPFNIAKYFYYTTPDNKNSAVLLETLKPYIGHISGLTELVEDYVNLLHSKMGTATVYDYVARELFLSSLEQLLILTVNGYSYGSCVSGKDRKAIEIMHTDAMLLFNKKYHSWPKFHDCKGNKERQNFVDLFVELYVSRHQQEHAGQNAPGADGIKTPGWYLPKDIINAINKRIGSEKAVYYDDRLATDNEVKNITKHLEQKVLSKNELLCKLIARQLGEANCTQLYDALNALINEKRQFKAIEHTWSARLFSSSIPKGIESIASIMEDANAGEDNISRMERIFAKVLTRPDMDLSRTETTNSVYHNINSLLSPHYPSNNLQKIVDTAVEEWTLLFVRSKTAEEKEVNLH